MNVTRQTRRLYPASDIRLARLRTGARLSDVAAAAGLTLTRASEIERYPERASSAEIDLLKTALAEIVSGGER